MSKPSYRFEALDALRGIAALLVAVYHLEPVKSGLGGHLMVELFLVLSGFVLAHSYLYKPERIGVLDFVYRRFARLWPLHVFALFFMYGVIVYGLQGVFFKGPHNNWNTLAQNLTLTHNIGLPPTGQFVWTWNFPSWSISVEFWVNVLFILLVFRSTSSWAIGLVSGIALGILWHGFGSLGTYNLNIYGVLSSGMLRGIASFGLGILAYRLFLRVQERRLPAWVATGLEAICLLVTWALLFAEHRGYATLELLAPPFFTLMVVVYALERGWIARASRSIAYIGTISYSVYLMHASMWVLFNDQYITQHIAPEHILPTALIATLFLSHFTFQFVEMPSKNFLMRYNPWRKKRPGAPVLPSAPTPPTDAHLDAGDAAARESVSE